MISWGTVVLCVAVGVANGGVPVRRVVETAEAVYFEPAATEQQHIIWAFPKTRVVVTRHEQDPAYLQVALFLRNVQLPADLGTLEPDWKGRQAVFHQVTSPSECTLERRPEMKFIQQWAKARGVTFPGAQRSAICSFTFKLRPETPELVQRLEEDAEAGRLMAHGLRLHLVVISLEPLRWATLHAGLVREGVEVDRPRASEFAAFELGALREVKSLQRQPAEVRQSFLEAALLNLFGWQPDSPTARLIPTAPEGQFEAPGVPKVISL